MFAVYNNGSVQFRSTSDNLYNLKNIEESAPSRHKPDDELYHNLENNSKKEKRYTQESIQAYKKIAHMDTTEIIYHVGDIMTQKCISINENATLNDAYLLLKEKQISQLPIVTDDNIIVNIINKKMILNLLMENFDDGKIILNKELKNITLNQFITTNPISDIRRVSKVMIENKIDAIPVVNEHGILVGIVSKTDIIKAVSYIPDLQLWG